MDKTLFKKIEWQLYNYFENVSKIEAYESKRELLKKNIDELERKIKTTDVILSPDVKSIGFSERVQTSNDGVSAAEKNMINLIEKLEREIEKREAQIVDLELSIMKRKEDNKTLDKFFDGRLKDYYRKLLEYKYRDGDSNIEICEKLSISETKLVKDKKKIIERVSRWEDSFLS
ncbi:hypothetical protein ACSW9V_10390 [Clostridium perfringens]|uniref:hypothetical protein n=1 Tax=Clostridium perfringens TaxID=1502 RepID=UPI001A23C20C|nr:hypothetical protein [Clostridium perfringens]HAT4162133.1 hypothetical protein [Clostridium perfringens]